MKQKLLASELTLFSCQNTVACSFKMEKTRSMFRNDRVVLWTVIARAVYRTTGFWRDQSNSQEN